MIYKTRKNKLVQLKVDQEFYDQIFEIERKKLSKLKGINFKNTEFTRYMVKSKVQFKYPKIKKYSPLKKSINKKLKNKVNRGLFMF